MIAFICLLALAIAVYLYRTVAQFGGGFSGGLETQGSAPAPFTSSPWALPAALAAGWVLKDFWTWSIGAPFHVMCHELGHSLAAWLAGRWSFPVIAGVAMTDQEPSLLLTALVAAGITWASWKAAKSRSPLGLLCCAALIGGFLYLRPAGHAVFMQTMLFAGHAGEFVFPALLLAAFYYRGPAGLRWDWFRYPVMAASACSLMAAWHFWVKAGADPVTGIYGVNIADRSMAGQDIARLVSEFGWTARLAADRYLLLGRAVWAFTAAFYIWFTLRRASAPAAENAGTDGQ